MRTWTEKNIVEIADLGCLNRPIMLIRLKCFTTAKVATSEKFY